MADVMTFPKTVDEFMEQYKIVDVEEVYTNGAELVPIFRMKQWFEHSEKRGRWIVVSDGYGNGDATAHICECSECKDTIWVYKKATRRWNYCPNCGAQMDLEEGEEKE